MWQKRIEPNLRHQLLVWAKDITEELLDSVDTAVFARPAIVNYDGICAAAAARERVTLLRCVATRLSANISCWRAAKCVGQPAGNM